MHNGIAIGKWFFMIFGLPFIPHEEIEDTFVEAVMSEAHVDARCTKFADCFTDNYVTQESRFPPSHSLYLYNHLILKCKINS
jgi:hypothetical protein